MTKITVYNLSVKIEPDNVHLKNLIDQFIKRYYTSRGLAANANTAGVDKEYVSRIGTNALLMHTNQFIHLLHHLKEIGQPLTNIERVDARDYPVVHEHYEMQDQWQLRDYQVPIFDFITNNPVRSKMVILQTGRGKAQPLDAKIKVPGGWSTMGQMQVGTVITAPDGKPTTVTGVYPQGMVDIYTVRFSDGRTSDACGQHLWKVRKANTWQVVNTLQVKGWLESENAPLAIPLVQPEVVRPQRLKIDPYLLGLQITLNNHKPVPQPYQNCDAQQMTEVLCGLLESRVRITGNAIPQFYTTSAVIAKNVQYLIWHLGGIAKLSQEGNRHVVTFNHPQVRSWVLEPKLREQLKNCPDLALDIVEVTYKGKFLAQCISVDHPDHLYVTNDFVVTHNTLVSLAALAKVGMRIGVTVLSTYLTKWHADILKTHKATTRDIMVVSGSKGIRGLLAMARDGELTTKYYLFSKDTVQDFITLYENNPEHCERMYGGTPFDLFTLTNIGSALIDETHQHFHAIFKIILYSNVRFQLGLSATLISDDPVVSRMHKIVYPDAQTYELQEMVKYIDVYALAYSIPESLMRKVKTTNFNSNNYSHSAFEKSMVKNRPHLDFYIQLITANLEVLYLDKYEEKDVCLIFVATVDFATILTKIYQQLLPHLKVRRYCEDDPDENLYESDVVVSTVISSGTAKDVPNLRVVLQTVSISSASQNIQNLGRLRELSDGRDTRFGYLFAENIRKQVSYHYRRQELFAPRSATHRTFKAKMTSTLTIPKV